MGRDVGTQGAPAQALDPFARLHAALLRQGDLQFALHPAPGPPPLPPWLKALLTWIGRHLVAIAPVFKYIFWAGVIAGVLLILYFIIGDIVAVRFGWRRRTRAASVQLDEDWKPSAERARSLLEDVDRLATAGRYDEAVHLLLIRSIEDIDARWPSTIRPALTSRDIASHPRLSDTARGVFRGIAEVVEHSLFGGARVAAGDFKVCREAYATFALSTAA